MKTVKTPKGTELPLVNLKGKDYLQVAHRLVWFNEASTKFNILTDFLVVNDEQTIARATVSVYDEAGSLIKTAQATKRETKKDFSDHTEKAETGAIGRALALMGYGTQFAIADLDEGNRLADSPVVNLKSTADSSEKDAPAANPKLEQAKQELAPKKRISSFRTKPPVTTTPTTEQAASNDGWE